MIKISKDSNPNYLAKIVKLQDIRKHSNADRLQIVTIDFQPIIIGLDAKEGDEYVFFPVECKINKEFLSYTNSFRKPELNKDKEKTGFFEDKCRVKAIKLRGEYSMGYLTPLNQLEGFIDKKIDVDKYLNQEFDTIDGIKLLEKYVIKERQSNSSDKKIKSPKLNRLIDGQVKLHVDTENLRKNIDKLKLSDTISITYKTHGTSFWVAHVLVKRKLNWINKLYKFLGIDVADKEFDIVYGSRNVVRNKYFNDPKVDKTFYSDNVWETTANEIGDKIPKGFTIYGEYLGFTKDGSYIQKDYDYGCKPNEHKLEVYRITYTNYDGISFELTYPQIVEFCERVNLTPSYIFYYGTVENLCKELAVDFTDRDWQTNLLKELENKYTEKNCFKCNNEVPEEGIVLRIENLFKCESYKLKSFAFLEKETKDLDNDS